MNLMIFYSFHVETDDAFSIGTGLSLLELLGRPTDSGCRAPLQK